MDSEKPFFFFNFISGFTKVTKVTVHEFSNQVSLPFTTCLSFMFQIGKENFTDCKDKTISFKRYFLKP